MVRDFAAWSDFIVGRQFVPFAWGRKRNDCFAYAIGAIAALTGRKVGGGVRWTGKTSALRRAREHGGLIAAVSAELREIAPAFAHRGDIAGILDDAFPGGVRLMVVEGEMLVGPGEHGNERLPRSAMTMAWSAEP